MRKPWDEYFIEIAQAASDRSTCDRLRVGCVLVQGKNILSTGYNGSCSGEPHCDDVGHDLEDGHCVATVHAEANAIAAAARRGIPLNGADAYVTHFPCWNCAKLLRQAGIYRIFYRDDYRNSRRVLKLWGTNIIQVKADG